MCARARACVCVFAAVPAFMCVSECGWVAGLVGGSCLSQVVVLFVFQGVFPPSLLVMVFLCLISYTLLLLLLFCCLFVVLFVFEIPVQFCFSCCFVSFCCMYLRLVEIAIYCRYFGLLPVSN